MESTSRIQIHESIQFRPDTCSAAPEIKTNIEKSNRLKKKMKAKDSDVAAEAEAANGNAEKVKRPKKMKKSPKMQGGAKRAKKCTKI